MKRFPLLLTVALLLGAGAGPAAAEGEPALYFPPHEGEWETVEPGDVGWDATRLREALDYAGANQSSAVVILHRGRILAEQTWAGKRPSLARRLGRGNPGETASGEPLEDVASVQKSVASILVGIAREKGLLDLDDRVDRHLGPGWSEATPRQEQAITIRHLITMTSGLSNGGAFEAPPGTRWRYRTNLYAKSMDILEKASGMDRHTLTREWLTGPLGMADSGWTRRGLAGLERANGFGFTTTARDLARFGLLMLAGGRWGDTAVLSDQAYLREATTSSQELNPYYGYLWWLNRNAFAPGEEGRIPAAPPDLFVANGASIRRCYVVPSLQLVVTRLGAQPDAGRDFDQEFWKRLMAAAAKPQ